MADEPSTRRLAATAGSAFVAGLLLLVIEGLTRLLKDAGHQVLVSVGDADSLVDQFRSQSIDIVIADVRMPPTMMDDGARAARELRSHRPDLPILLLSQHIETRQSVELVSSGSYGYLLKDRVLKVDDFLDAVTRVSEGGSALDPQIVAALVRPSAPHGHLGDLSQRERERDRIQLDVTICVWA